MENLYLIKTESQTLSKMKFNAAQEQLWEFAQKKKHRGMRLLNLKVRKRGVTTFWCIYYLDEVIFNANNTALILAHRKPDVQKIFEIVKVGYESMPNEVVLADGRIWTKPRPTYDNKNELTFRDHGSMIYVDIENRGGTNHHLHISEAAHILDESRIQATLGSVPEIHTGSNITAETTANGVGGWFHESWQDAEAALSLYVGLFFSWIDDPKYSIDPPADYKPSETVLAVADKIKTYYGKDLTLPQMFWWEMKKYDQKKLMDQEFPSIPSDAFLVSGNIAFEPDVVAAIETTPPILTKWGVSIWKKPREGRRYVLSIDVAEGIGGDRSVIEVIDQLTLEQVAEYASDKIKPADLGDLACKLGYYYNTGLIAPELNNHGHTVIQRLKDNRYPNIFRMVNLSDRRDKKVKKLGWETNSKTRDLILDEMDDHLTDKTTKINSAKLKGELQTFIINDEGKREAKTGTHDDRVIAYAIGLKICGLPRRSFAAAALD